MGSLTGKQESDIPEQATEDGRILPRTRLIEGLLAAKAVRVVLLEAPAGYSKTTTLRLWEREDSRDFAWVSCQTRHNDPSVLIEEIVFALSRFGQIDDEVLMALGSPTPDLNLVLGRLARAIEAMDPFVLAIDDAHLLEADNAWQVIYTVIVALPERSQIAIATRSRPGLPVGRLRARGELHDFGMTELALTRRESRELLTGLDPRLGERADQIHDRTEGWPAALYLAGLTSRADNADATEAVDFSGGDRVVVEYFRDEFFQGMDDWKAEFLYRTSILEELSGPI